MLKLGTIGTGTFLVLAAGAIGCTQSTVPEEEVGRADVALSSLPSSTFEIDDDANLILSGDLPNDWINVAEERQSDDATGTNDSSYSGGAKENDTCPGTTTGSIPNNKSDLLSFGVYVEPDSPGFLHLFWTRVQEPSGTTLIDFELNQSSVIDADCGNGVNPVRTIGDLLIEYRIEQGGATAQILIREWTGSEWGPAQDLTAVGAATGTINHTAIPASESDGLGALSPRTFGEASIDLDFIFDDAQCTSFGSAFVKSRASDAFTSQLKDYIPPREVSISNCGRVIIRKETTPDGLTDSFTFTHNLQADPPIGSTTFMLADGESETFTDVLLNGGSPDYTVTETVLSGFDLTGIDCSASSGVTPTVDLATATVTFALDDTADVVDCTFHNSAPGSITIVKETSDGTGTFPFTGSLGAFSLTTTGEGAAGSDSTTFDDLAAGTYSVAETVPTGWSLASATCSDGSDPSSIALGTGEDVTCTFVNDPLSDLVCTAQAQVSGTTVSTVSCTGPGGLSETSGTASDPASLSLSDLGVGTYTCTIVIE